MKRRRMTRESLDELAATMPIISESELFDMIGEGGQTYYFDSYWGMVSFLSAHTMSPDYVEASFFGFDDGTYAVYIDDFNEVQNSYFTRYPNQDGTYSLEPGGKTIVSRGHTHIYSNEASTADKNAWNGVPRYIFYSCILYSY